MPELLAGLSLGLAAGISPGPLNTLIVTSTLSRGLGAGWRVAIAPLLTDVPIVVIAISVLRAMPERWLTVLGAVGGGLIVGLGLWEIRQAASREDDGEAGDQGTGQDMLRGAAVNLTNPHPWVFWATAGAPLVIVAWRDEQWRAVAFLGAFYLMLVGSKLGLAVVIAGIRHRLSPTWRRRLALTGGLVLVGGGVVLLTTFL